jgi:hypothetical protein
MYGSWRRLPFTLKGKPVRSCRESAYSGLYSIDGQTCSIMRSQPLEGVRVEAQTRSTVRKQLTDHRGTLLINVPPPRTPTGP